MAGLLNKKKALHTMKNYFFLLEKVGYVKDTTIRKFLVYLFLVDFVEHVEAFLTEDDYIMIDRILKRTFTNGGCLLPFQINCADSAKVGGVGDTNTCNG